MATTGLVIPASFGKRDVNAVLNKTLEKLGMTMEQFMKSSGSDRSAILDLAKESLAVRLDEAKKQEDANTYLESIADNMLKSMSPKENPALELYQPWYIKMIHKATKYWDKNVVKNKFFGKALDLLKQGLKHAGSFLMDLLKGIIALAIFDPKGTLMAGIVGFIAKAIVWAIELFAKLAPRIIDALVVAVPRIASALWDAFKLISQTIGNAFFQIITDMLKKLQEHYGKGPVISMLIKFFDYLKDPAIAKTVGMLIVGSAILGKMGMLGPLLSLLWKGLAFILPVIGSFLMESVLPFLAFLLGAFLPVILTVAAIAGAIYLVYKYSDKIVGFFEGLWTWFTKLSNGMKILVGVIAAILFPITLVALAVYGLAKLFQYFSKVGIAGFKKDLSDFFLKTLPAIWVVSKKKLWSTVLWLKSIFTKFIPGLFKYLSDAVTQGFKKNLVNFFVKIIPEWWKKGKNTLMSMLIWVKDLFVKLIPDMFMSAYDSLKRIQKKIFDIFSFANLRAVIESGIDYVFGTGTFQKISDYITKAFSMITDFMQGFINWILGKISKFIPGLSQFKGYGEAGLAASIQTAGLVRETNMDVGTAGALTAAIAKGDVKKIRELGTQANLSAAEIQKVQDSVEKGNPEQRDTVNILKEIRDNIKKSPGKPSVERVIR